MVTSEISLILRLNESDTKMYYQLDGLEVVSVKGVMPVGLYLLE